MARYCRGDARRASRADARDLSAKVRRMGRMVALLRAVNVGGRKLPMAELRALCAGLGWSDVATYIQSGNLVFTAPGKPDAIEAALEDGDREAIRLRRAGDRPHRGRMGADIRRPIPSPRRRRTSPTGFMLLALEAAARRRAPRRRSRRAPRPASRSRRPATRSGSISRGRRHLEADPVADRQGRRLARHRRATTAPC